MEKLSKISKLFYKIYYNLFIENFKGKLEYNFPSDYYRWDLIKYLINKYNYIDYLEIGCDQDQLFSKIDIQNKVGVDPVSGGNLRKIIKNLIWSLLMDCILINKSKKI